MHSARNVDVWGCGERRRRAHNAEGKFCIGQGEQLLADLLRTTIIRELGMKIGIFGNKPTVNGVTSYMADLAEGLRADTRVTKCDVVFRHSVNPAVEYKFATPYLNGTTAETYDVGIVNDDTVFDFAFDRCKKLYFVIHSMDEHEQYARYRPTNQYSGIICLSEFVFRHFNRTHDAFLSRQPIGQRYFDLQQHTRSNDEMKHVFIIDTRSALEYEQNICLPLWRAGYAVHAVGHMIGNIDHHGTEDFIRHADLVIGYGRVVLEALAAGRNAIVYGVNGGDGAVYNQSFNVIASRNFSGHATRVLKRPLELSIKEFEIELGAFRLYNEPLDRLLIEPYQCVTVAKEVVDFFGGGIKNA